MIHFNGSNLCKNSFFLKYALKLQPLEVVSWAFSIVGEASQILNKYLLIKPQCEHSNFQCVA